MDIEALLQDPAEIIKDHLYLGSNLAAKTKEKLLSRNIKYILNATRECTNHFENEFSYLQLKLLDEMNETIPNETLESALNFILKAKQEGAAVLVHCQAGISRSSFIVLLYLMKHENMELRKAFFYVKQRRHIIQPNLGFMNRLQLIDKELYGTNSFSMKEYYVTVLEEMGFKREAILNALEMSQSRFDLAINILLSHQLEKQRQLQQESQWREQERLQQQQQEEQQQQQQPVQQQQQPLQIQQIQPQQPSLLNSSNNSVFIPSSTNTINNGWSTQQHVGDTSDS